MVSSNSPRPGIPFEVPDADETDDSPDTAHAPVVASDQPPSAVLGHYFPDLDPGDPLLATTAQLAVAPDPHDGLREQAIYDDDNATPADPAIQNWRLLSPDDPKGTVVQARISDGAIKKMDHLISRTRGEVWASRSDFMREALWFYLRGVLEGLQVTDPTLVTLLAEAELAGRAAFHSARKKRLDLALEHTRNYLTDLLNLDDRQEAHRFLQELAARIRDIKVVPWKRQWLLALNNLPLLKVMCRWLDVQGFDIPLEFYPAAGKTLPGGTAPHDARHPIPAPGPEHPDRLRADGGVRDPVPGEDPGE